MIDYLDKYGLAYFYDYVTDEIFIMDDAAKVKEIYEKDSIKKDARFIYISREKWEWMAERHKFSLEDSLKFYGLW